MVEHGVSPIDTMVEPNHPLKGRSLSELNLKIVPSLTEKSTLADV